VTQTLERRHKIKDTSEPGFQVINQGSLLETTSSTSSVFTTLLGEVAAISLLVGGIGVMNIMLVSVTERTREIGIRKAIGARRSDILTQFLTEAVLVSLFGGVTGVLVGVLGSQFEIAGVHPAIATYSIFLAFGAAVLTGLFFGTYPAGRAARLRPIEALRLSSDQPHPTDEEFAMSTEHTAIPNPADAERERRAPADAQTLAAAAPASEAAYTPLTDAPLTDEWAQDDETLPPRPRRRLLGKGGNPVQVALLGVLLLACGFIGGVLVEKGQTSASASGAGGALASRFAALRGAASSASGTAPASSGGGSGGAAAAGGAAASGGSAAPGGFAGRFGGAGGATIGEVAYISGSTLYVTNTEGDTVKVSTSAASSITKTVKTDVHGIHPGETVIVRGTRGANGAVSAESVSVSTGAAAGGGLSALFGGGASGAAGGQGAARSGAAGSAAGGEPALFGK
jgi:hypothetical protein